MIRGDRLAATVSLVRQAHTLEDLAEIEERVLREGIEDPHGVYARAFIERLETMAELERARR